MGREKPPPRFQPSPPRSPTPAGWESFKTGSSAAGASTFVLAHGFSLLCIVGQEVSILETNGVRDINGPQGILSWISLGIVQRV